MNVDIVKKAKAIAEIVRDTAMAEGKLSIFSIGNTTKKVNREDISGFFPVIQIGRASCRERV